jgi:hypothetical protein
MEHGSDEAGALALNREQAGHDAFITMFRAWVRRSAWSLQVMSDLCETAVRQAVAPQVPSWQPGVYETGDLVVANGWVWEAMGQLQSVESPQRGEEISNGFRRITLLRRMQPSQLHALDRDAAKQFGAVIFDTLGTLNLYLVDLRSGKAPAPSDERLAEKASLATVIEDSDGPFGPEEFFSVFIGRLQPPFSLTQLTPKQAMNKSRQLARRIREGMMEAGLDLVDDWSRFVAVYPSSDSSRLAKVRDVTLGRAAWAAEQVEDEAAAVEIALKKLRRQVSKEAQASS